MSPPVKSEAATSIIPSLTSAKSPRSEHSPTSSQWPEPHPDTRDMLPPHNITSNELLCPAELSTTTSHLDTTTGCVATHVVDAATEQITSEREPDSEMVFLSNHDDEDGNIANSDNNHGENESNDFDSAIGTSFISDTTSLNSMITAYRVENGRQYHAYKDGAYWAPNDEQQNEQLDIGHHLHTLILDGRLFLAPVSPYPQKVLDLGTGTGIWAIDFADQYTSAVVIGTDLSPTQPRWVPPNVRFEIEDFNDEWTFRENEFDFIHMRNLAATVGDWNRFYEQVYKHLKPGAWLEQYEISVTFKSDDGSVKSDSEMELFNYIGIEGGIRMGKSATISEDMYQLISSAGFVSVTQKEFKAPHGSWHPDPKWKEIGNWGLLELEVGLEGFGMAILTRLFGWTTSAVHLHGARIRAELRDPDIHSYHFIRVVYAQKPYEP